MASLRPNILWITLDSVKASALPAYGNPYCQAPYSERVAARGVVISEAICQVPKCIPGRQTMLTGRYPHADGLCAMGHQATGETHGAFTPMVLPYGTPSLLTILKEHDYTLLHTGCQHLVSQEAYEKLFDIRVDWELMKACPPLPQPPGGTVAERALYAGPWPRDFPADLLPDACAARQMAEGLSCIPRHRPFFAYLDLRAPHPYYRDWPVFDQHYRAISVPVPPKRRLRDAPWTERIQREVYDLEQMPEADWQQVIKAYYSAISYNDMLVGRVLETLARTGREDDTIVLYSADHGDFAGEHGCVEKHDPILYDCHVRLPLILQLPAGWPRGERREALVEMIDLAPTLLELCGWEPPPWMQGRSFVPTIRDGRVPHKDAAFAQGGVEKETLNPSGTGRPNIRIVGDNPTIKERVALAHPDFMLKAKMVRTRTHKMIYRLNGHHEMYDLVHDPQELQNVWDDAGYAGERSQLLERLVRHLTETERTDPELNGIIA